MSNKHDRDEDENDHDNGYGNDDGSNDGDGGKIIVGTPRDDLLSGKKHDDRVIGNGGDDLIAGGRGSDTVAFSGTRDDYRVDLLAYGTVKVTDLRDGSPDGTDYVLSDVEWFEFVRGSSPDRYSAADVLNDRPRAAADAVSVGESGGTVLAAALLANDVEFDPVDTLTLVSVQGAASGTVSLDADGDVVYAPVAGLALGLGETATDTFTYTVRDAAGLESTATATVTVVGENGAPTAVADGGDVDEDLTWSGNVFANDTDPDAGTVFGVAGLAAGEFHVMQGQFGTLKLWADGSCTYMADRSNGMILGESGSDSFTYEMSDGQGGTTTGTFAVTVHGQDEHLVGTDALDLLVGGRGADILEGRGGRDVLHGGKGGDRLLGEGGNDILDGGQGWDTLEGGVGNDLYRLRDGDDTVVELVGEGIDSVYTGGDFDLADGVAVERIVAVGATGRELAGNEFANMLFGGAGDDRLSGEGGADALRGREGDDALDGGAGRDVLIGGDGADTFVFAEAIHSTLAQADRILDFDSAGGDLIDLSGIDALLGTDGDQAFTFIGTDAFTGAGGELRLKVIPGYAQVFADIDGDRDAEFSITLRGNVAPTADDVLL